MAAVRQPVDGRNLIDCVWSDVRETWTNMTSFRKGIATLLMAWLTILSQVAVAMPFCERGHAQERPHSTSAEHSAHVSSSAANGHAADCPQHKEHEKKHGNLDCDSCALCHIASNVMPSIEIDLIVAHLARADFPTCNTSAASFFPETPQPIPVAIPS
jgi:hypothetical protein